jgi:hypothetical protein
MKRGHCVRVVCLPHGRAATAALFNRDYFGRASRTKAFGNGMLLHLEECLQHPERLLKLISV